MWATLHRARRRILRDDQPSACDRPDHEIDPIPPGALEPASDVSVSLNRPELERLMASLARALGTHDARPDTPARLEAALSAAIGAVEGTGTPAVTRRPAGLYTPETWQVAVHAADERTRAALLRAIQGEDFT